MKVTTAARQAVIAGRFHSIQIILCKMTRDCARNELQDASGNVGYSNQSQPTPVPPHPDAFGLPVKVRWRLAVQTEAI